MTTQGKRLYEADDASVGMMNPGEYLKRGDGLWFCYPPREGAGPVNISTWTITEYEDGTITVSPSIHVHEPNGWHGFLEHGIWREV